MAKKPKEKMRMELRLDHDVYQNIQKLANKADISVNQLMQGIACWAAKYGHPGDPFWNDKDKVFESIDTSGCVWFGREEDQVGFDGTNYGTDPAELYFSLDFTDKGAVRDHRKIPVKKVTIKKPMQELWWALHRQA